MKPDLVVCLTCILSMSSFSQYEAGNPLNLPWLVLISDDFPPENHTKDIRRRICRCMATNVREQFT